MTRLTVTTGDGVDLAVTQHSSDGPTLVLVHGFPDTSRVWDEVVERLRDRYAVVTYDVRGAGGSGAPTHRAGYALPQLADDLVAVIDAVSPDEPAHVVGHDWGAIQTFEAVTTEHRAHRIASFTCVSGASFDHTGRLLRHHLRRGPAGLAPILEQLARSWYIMLFQLPVVPEQTLAMGLGRPMVELFESVTPRDGHPAASFPSDCRNGIELYRANLRRVWLPRRGDVLVPLQVVVGTDDPVISDSLFDQLEQRAPNGAYLRRLPGRHWLPRTHPDRVAAAVEELVEATVAGRLPGAADAAAADDDAVAPGLRAAARRAAEPRARAPFDGRVAVVTGAGNGIGRATALALAERGAAVAVVDLDRQAAERTGRFVEHLGVPVSVHDADVGDPAAMTLLVKDVVRAVGVPDIIVNNAGIGMQGAFLDTSLEDWDRMLRVNLLGVVHGTRLFVAELVATGRRGHVVNLSSGLAYTPARDMSAYVATKAAVLRLSEVLRNELADAGIGVSAICPGIVDTGITSRTAFVGVDEREAGRRRDAASTMYRRRSYGPEKVAEAIVDAVLHDRAIVPVTPEARVGWVMSRVTPGLHRRLAGVDVMTRIRERNDR